MDNFRNGDPNVQSKLALLNTKNPLYQSSVAPFTSTFTESGSADLKVDPNSISIRSLEPSNINHIGEMYMMDKTITAE